MGRAAMLRGFYCALALIEAVIAMPVGEVTLFKIDGDECGQVTLDEKYAAGAKKFAGMEEGTCPNQGYTVPAGSEDLTVPVVGHIKVDLFKKAGLLGFVEGLAPAVLGMASASGQCCTQCEAPQVKYYSVDSAHGHCGECCMLPRFFPVFKIFEPNLTLAEGKACRDLGFPIYDETVTHGVYPLSMTLDMYNPAAVEIVTWHKIVDGVCAQVVLKDALAMPLVKLASLSKGSCLEQGFAQDAGSADLSLAILGHIKVQMSTKVSVADIATVFQRAFHILEEFEAAPPRSEQKSGSDIAGEMMKVMI